MLKTAASKQTTAITPYSLSTALLVGAVALALSAIFLLIPWNALAHLRQANTTWINQLQLGLFFGAPLWIGVFLFVNRLAQQQRQAHALSATQKHSLSDHLDRDLINALRDNFPVLDAVGLRIRGRIESVRDSGKRINISPRSYKISGQRFLIFSALTFKRLQTNPNALSAVLAHELAHFQNKDMEWLSLSKRLLWATASLFLVYYLLSIYDSVIHDMAVSPSVSVWPAIQAAVVGKSFGFTGFFTLALMAIYVRTLNLWREALADYAAVTSQGEQALRDAERLMHGDNKDSSPELARSRPDQSERSKAITLTARHWLLLGAVISIVASNLNSQFSYIGTSSDMNQPWSELSQWIAVALNGLLPYLGFAWLLNIFVTASLETSRKKVMAKYLTLPCLFLIAGAATGNFFTRVVPLGLQAIAMPEGHDLLNMHDPLSLFITTTLSSISTNAWLITLALLGVVGSVTTGLKFVRWLPGLVWIAFSIVEQRFFPSLLLGSITPFAIFILAAMIVVVAYRSKDFSFDYSWISILGLASIYWAGLGDINHLAATSHRAAKEAESRGDWDSAVALHSKAVLHSPGLPKTKLPLVFAMFKSGNTDKAIEASESVVESPFMHSWEEKFTALTLTASLHFHRRSPSNLQRADELYAKAEWYWRRNALLEVKLPGVGVEMLYNQSCIKLLTNKKPTLRSIAGLIEALILDPSIAVTLLNDKDLRSLNLQELSPAPPALYEKLALLESATAPSLVDFATENAWGTKELTQILLLFVARVSK